MRPLVPSLAIIALFSTPHIVCSADADGSKVTTVTSLAEEDREILTETCHLVSYSVQAVDSMKERAKDGASKDLLGAIRKDASTMQSELAELMRSKAIPTPMLEEDYQDHLAEIAQAEPKEVYATYRDYQMDVSEDLVEVLKEASEDAKDADVRAFAVKWLPAAQKQVDLLKTYKPVQ